MQRAPLHLRWSRRYSQPGSSPALPGACDRLNLCEVSGTRVWRRRALRLELSQDRRVRGGARRPRPLAPALQGGDFPACALRAGQARAQPETCESGRRRASVCGRDPCHNSPQHTGKVTLIRKGTW